MKTSLNKLIVALFLCLGVNLAQAALPPEPPYCPLSAGWLYNKSQGTSAVAFGDGSQWRVAADDTAKLEGWDLGDLLVVSPNFTPLSPFPYWIKNITKESLVLAHMYMGPEPFGINSHWIAVVDKQNLRVFLENRIGFEIDLRDRDLLELWSYKDPIIIGKSNSWFTPYDYLLINTNHNIHVRAKIY